MERPRTVGIAWYRREDYGRILAVMADGDRLPGTYESWLLSAEQVAEEVARSGVAVSRVVVVPDEFAAWCAAQGVRCDGQARARYANEAQPGLTPSAS